MNKVILIGRLTKDPIFSVSPSGVEVTRFTVAVTRKFSKDEADFIPCVAFKKTAQFVNNYFRKGSAIVVVGSVQTLSWEQDGQKKYATKIAVDEVEFCGSKEKSDDDGFSPVNQDDGWENADGDNDKLPF